MKLLDPLTGPRTALLAMDLQRDFLEPGGRLPIEAVQIGAVVAGMNRALIRAARGGVAVVYVLNAYDLLDPSNLTRNFAALRGSPGAALDPRVTVVQGAPIVRKKVPDAFSNPALADWLARERITRLAVGGVYADACVTATCRSALKRGYAVEVLADAVGARSEAARRHAVADLVRRGARAASADGRGWT
ncbi:MAG: cysteine hydrolase family protein [Caulobacteraceae bacterium]